MAMGSRAETILVHAARQFAERGFGGTSIDDIGAAAGVSGPAVYWHFKNKQALLAEMLTDISDRLLAGAKACVATADGPHDALTRLIDAQVAFAVSEPDLIVIHAREMGHLDPASRHRVRRTQRLYLEEWVGVLQQLNARRSVEEQRARAQAAIGLINTTPYLSKLDHDVLTAMLRDMAHAALTIQLDIETHVVLSASSNRSLDW
jgi:AcrR family transcriptional regulator